MYKIFSVCCLCFKATKLKFKKFDWHFLFQNLAQFPREKWKNPTRTSCLNKALTSFDLIIITTLNGWLTEITKREIEIMSCVFSSTASVDPFSPLLHNGQTFLRVFICFCRLWYSPIKFNAFLTPISVNLVQLTRCSLRWENKQMTFNSTRRMLF